MGNPGVVRTCGYAMWHIGDVNGRWECKRPQHVDVFQGSFPLERTWYNTQPCEDKKLRPSHLLKRNLIYQIYWSDNSGLEEAFLERENLTQGTFWKCYCLSWCCLSQNATSVRRHNIVLLRYLPILSTIEKGREPSFLALFKTYVKSIFLIKISF